MWCETETEGEICKEIKSVQICGDIRRQGLGGLMKSEDIQKQKEVKGKIWSKKR